jgi:non-ribosomal peptide synthetase component E (peptide arylation enzyme)
MILNDARGKSSAFGGGVTLDDLFRRAAVRVPDTIALVDPLDRATVTGGAPRRLTFAQADHCIDELAERFRSIGLATDAIVGLQTANIVDGVLALLAVLRAGLVAMPMPLLWRRADAVHALGRVGATALIVSGRIGDTDHYDLALQIASEVFSVRHVCGFGDNAPDGVIALDDLTVAERLDHAAAPARVIPAGRGAHVAVVTWDVTAAGPLPVARSHAELIAGGLAVQLEGQLGRHAKIHATLTLSSFAGLATALVPWLLSGGTLVLHHPFDPEGFKAQAQAMACDTAIVPGPMVAQLAQAGLLSSEDGLKRVVGVWRAPERLSRALSWRDPSVALIDVQVFGETGLIAAARGADGKPAAIPVGPLRAPRSGRNALMVGEAAATRAGTLALRGTMVATRPFPPGAERGELPFVQAGADGFVDTGYACRLDRDATLTVKAPPAGLVGVGGYRFVMQDLQDRAVASGATLAVLPDALTGARLAGNSDDHTATRESLAALGANPLITNAFHGMHRSLTGR